MAITLTTFSDIGDHLEDVRFGGSAAVDLRVMKRAVRMGYRQLMEAHDWRYFIKEHKFLLNVAVEGSTGVTLAYDHTGGSSERLLTLSGSTFPTWLSTNPRHGQVKIDSEVYKIETYLSTTTATLDANYNPGADIAATDNWTIFRDTYPAPDDFGGMHRMTERDHPFSYGYIDEETYHTYKEHTQIGQPYWWTILRDNDREGGFVVRTLGWPTEADRFSYLYRSRSTDPTLSGLETKATVGTVAITADSTTVTGSGTAFDSSMVGAVLRVSADTSAPTSYEGTNPPAEEHVIRAVTNATSLELWTAASQSLSGKAYIVSSLVDVEPGAMINALMRACEHQLAILLDDPAKSQAKFAEFVQALGFAQMQDAKTQFRRVSGSGYGPGADLDEHTFANETNTTVIA